MRFSCGREPKGKATAAAFAGFVYDVATVGAGDLAGERQAEAGALDAAAQGIVGAIKLFEDFFFAAVAARRGRDREP